MSPISSKKIATRQKIRIVPKISKMPMPLKNKHLFKNFIVLTSEEFYL